MLNFFPTPLDGELWYSVLCRYHVSSGNLASFTTYKELFRGRPNPKVSSPFPNSTVYEVVSQLPSNWDCKEIIKNHTLFPYYMRMYPLAQKERMLEELCRGETQTWTPASTIIKKKVGWTLRYCPFCVKEDMEKYGEPYWHTVHQIPLATVCCKHDCKLRPMEQAESLRNSLCPLSMQPLSEEILPAEFPWEKSLSKILSDHLTKPYQISPTLGYNNLVQVMLDQGYGLRRRKNISLNGRRIHRDMCKLYGEDLVKKLFGEKMSVPMNRAIIQWRLLSLERYVLLQGFFDVSFDTMFNPKPLADGMFEKLKAFSETGVKYGKQALADKLGLTLSQIKYLSKEYQLNPFGEDPMPNEEKKTKAFVMHCTLENREKIHQAAIKMGFQHDSHFAEYCIKKVMDEILD